MIEEIVGVAVTGALVATLPPQPFSRRVQAVSVSTTSSAQTIATVHVDSLYSPYVDGTSTGNGDAGGADGTVLPVGSRLLVRWLGATAGAEARAMVGWEQLT